MLEVVGSISFNPKIIIGQGSSSVVYRGKWGQRDVAVKRVDKANLKLVQREILLLQKSDQHRNIIRYFTTEDDSRFHYIALELCAGAIKDYVKNDQWKARISPKSLISQMFEGLEWLHSLSIIHRDIKPTNVLLMEMSTELVVKISDFGFAKQVQVPDSQMSVVPDGSDYWRAPEMDQGRYDKKSDVYSMGRLVLYIANGGSTQEPTGFSFASGATNFAPYCKNSSSCILLHHIVFVMTKPDPSSRPSINCIRYHPFFWENQKALNFFLLVADRIKVRDGSATNAINFLQTNAESIIGSDWTQRLEPVVIDSLAYRSIHHNYGRSSVSELLRAFRNKEAHYDEMSKAAKDVYGPLPDEFTAYWTSKFTFLLLHVYLQVHNSGLYADNNFQQFYPENQKCDNVRSAN